LTAGSSEDDSASDSDSDDSDLDVSSSDESSVYEQDAYEIEQDVADAELLGVDLTKFNKKNEFDFFVNKITEKVKKLEDWVGDLEDNLDE